MHKNNKIIVYCKWKKWDKNTDGICNREPITKRESRDVGRCVLRGSLQPWIFPKSLVYDKVLNFNILDIVQLY